MTQPTLHVAASIALRSFRIDMEKGGIMTRETLIAMDSLQRALAYDPPAPHEPSPDDIAREERWRKL